MYKSRHKNTSQVSDGEGAISERDPEARLLCVSHAERATSPQVHRHTNDLVGTLGPSVLHAESEWAETMQDAAMAAAILKVRRPWA